MRISPLALLALLPLAACGTAKEAVVGPSLTPLAYPSSPQTSPSLMAPRPVATRPASANSLWQADARAFFNDQRASRVGDILTVQISIDDSAKTSNATNSSKTSSTNSGLTSLGGFESKIAKILPSGANLSKLADFGSDSSSAGAGTVTRAEKINLTVAAVVTGVMPNGNLVIKGSQEVRTNYDLRELTVAGIVRPSDISSTNTIRHTQIAEARISYGGRGDIARVQKSPAAQALVQQFSPF